MRITVRWAAQGHRKKPALVILMLYIQCMIRVDKYALSIGVPSRTELKGYRHFAFFVIEKQDDIIYHSLPSK